MSEWSERIFGFWTGDNEMSPARARCWQSFELTGLRPLLITPENLMEWVVPDHPLHKGYEYLSPVHRADYLRGYFMFHHGGGYSDIKEQTGSWTPSVQRLLSSRRLIGAGYREIRGGTVWLERNRVHNAVYLVGRSVPLLVAKAATFAMRAYRPLMIGNGAYIFKPRTSFARRWLKAAEWRLDLLLPELRAHPAQEPRDRQGWKSGYPVPWAFLLGDIFHPLCVAYSPVLARDLPRPSLENYL